MKTPHFAFPSIEQLRNVVHEVKFNTQLVGDPEAGFLNESIPLPLIEFTGTVKLHGTNAGIIWDKENKRVYAQSRERVITPENDNGGFARFVSTLPHDDLLFSLKKGEYSYIKIYGEWCGQGIQKGVAINALPRMFVVFAGQVDDR